MSNSTKIQLSIPDTICFADLKLTFDPSGGVSFNWEPIERICGHNGCQRISSSASTRITWRV